MVEHQGDVTEVEYPEHPNNLPKDAGETFDMVVRKGPISLDGLMDQIYSYSQDEVFTHLRELKRAGYVDRVEGDIEEHGTTRDVWYVPMEDND